MSIMDLIGPRIPWFYKYRLYTITIFIIIPVLALFVSFFMDWKDDVFVIITYFAAICILLLSKPIRYVFGIEYFDFTVEGREVDRKTFYKEKNKNKYVTVKINGKYRYKI
jgi:hypothetical protein